MRRPGFLLISVVLLSSGFYLHFVSGARSQQAAAQDAVNSPAAQAADIRPQDPAADPLPDPVTAGPQSPPTVSPPRPAPALEPEIRDALKGMLNTSSEGLEVQEHNGVRSINLQGRFRTAPVATIDEHGEAHVTDYSWVPSE